MTNTSPVANFPADNVRAAHQGHYTTQLICARELMTLTGPWERLYDCAIEANPFYGPDYLKALATSLMSGRKSDLDWRACVVWHHAGQQPARMAAMLPLSPHRGLFSPLRALRHPFIVGGAPLLDAADPAGAASALLDGLCEEYRRPILVFDDMRLDWPAARALLQACETDSRSSLVFDVYHRPGVTSADSAAAMDRSVLKNLRRRSKRLSETGEVSITAPSSPEDCARALRDFLNLEERGWKGRKKTALASRPETLAFAGLVFNCVNTRPGIRFEVLRCNDQTLAANVNLVARDHAAAVKSAYDENYNTYSPGLMLDASVADTLRLERWTPLLDSVAMPGHPLEKLWVSPIRVGSIAMAADRRKNTRNFDARVSIERLRRRGREFAKEIYNSVR